MIIVTQGSENFFYTLEQIIKKEINNMNMENLCQFLLYYVNSEREDQIFKHEMISLIEERLSKKYVFLNNTQLLTALFAFLKYGKGKQEFYEAMQERTINLLDKFTADQIQRLIILYSNLPKYAPPIFQSIEDHVRKNFQKVSRPFVSTIFQSFTELNFGSQELYNIISDYLLKNVYNMSNDEFVRNLFSYSIQKKLSYELYFNKAVEVIQTNLKSYSGKELATIIWSLSNVNYPQKEIYDDIEQHIIESLYDEKYSIKDISTLIWAYIQRVPLRLPTVEKMMNEIVRMKNDADAWDISTIVWGIAKFDQLKLTEFMKNVEKNCNELIPEMNPYQISITARAYAEARVGTIEFIKTIQEKVDEIINSLNLNEVVTCIYSFSLFQEKTGDNFAEIINKLKQRAKDLQSQMVVQPNSKKPESDIGSVEEYLKNETRG